MSFDQSMKFISGDMSFFQNPKVVIGMTILIIVYCSFLVDHIPDQIKEAMDSCIGKGIILALIAYIASKSPIIGILLAAAFIFTVQKLNKGDDKSVTFSDPLVTNEEPDTVQVVEEDEVVEDTNDTDEAQNQPSQPEEATQSVPIPSPLPSGNGDSELQGAPL